MNLIRATDVARRSRVVPLVTSITQKSNVVTRRRNVTEDWLANKEEAACERPLKEEETIFMI